MNGLYAETLLRQCKRNVGRILAEFRSIKENPDNFSLSRRKECSSLLSANQSQVADLLKRYPKLRPERVCQLKLEL
jgi:hypothetical protein